MNDLNKNEKFVKLAESRTNKIIKTIKLLSNLSNRSYYAYSDTDIKAIFEAIEKEIKLAKLKFQQKGKNNNVFKLPKI